MTRFPVVVHHNPDCGTSRNVLRIIEAAGYSPTLIDYQREGWTRPHLLTLFAAAGLTPREALREKDAAALAPDLLNASAGDIVAAMIQHPILVQRPFVATPRGVKLCRSDSATVLDLLDQWSPGPFHKEDGAMLIDAEGKRA